MGGEQALVNGIRVALGTMTIGPAIGSAHITGEHSLLPSYCQTPPEDALRQIELLVATERAFNPLSDVPEAGKVMIDTASLYQNWETESVVGSILAARPDLRTSISVHSKANAGQKPYRALSKQSVVYQCRESLRRLQVSCIDVYYLHQPDYKTPIDDTLDAIAELHATGLIREFGLSNYPAYKVADIWHRCAARGIVKPTVAQYCYNAITRSPEAELAPCLRELGIRSYHYNPLAGGLLTGKYKSIEDEAKDAGRFGIASPISGAAYSARYWKPKTFEAVELIRAACEASGQIPMAEAALRWLCHHSVLSPEHHDGIIIGASSLGHAEANFAAVAEGPLPATVIEAYDAAWQLVRPDSTGYFSGYDAVPGWSTKYLETMQDRVPRSTPL